MNVNQLALLITAIAAVGLGIAVYQRNPDRVWNRIFAIHAAGGGVWTFINYMIMSADTAAEAGMYLRLTHPVVAIVICTVVDFAWVFPERIDYAGVRLRAGLYALGGFMGTVAFAPNLYHVITIEPGVVNVVYGSPFLPFGIFTVLALGYADVVLLRKAIRLEGVQRVQVMWVLIGLAGSHLVASIAIIIIPLIWRTTAYSGWGAGGYIITLAGMSYAIVRHRLVRPETALRRLASAMLSAGLVLSLGVAGLETARPALVAAGFPASLVYVSVGLVMGLLIIALYERVTVLLRPRVTAAGDPAAVHAETSAHILRTLDADQLVRYLARALASALDPSSVVVYTRDPAGADLAPRTVVGSRPGENAERWQPQPISRTGRIVEIVGEEGALVTRDQVFRFMALADARDVAREMERMDAQVVAPMVWEDELIGLVTLGPKLSGDMYGDEDLRFVADMALQASLALRNAELYAQTATLMEFNERILRQMDNAVVVTDPQERIVVFNEAAERLFGISSAEAIGHAIAILPAGVAECIRSSLLTGRTLPSQQSEFERGERLVPLACSASPLAGDGDRSQGAVAVISDLTIIQELDREREEAERLSLIRVISAGMAHEIRNPLVAIRTFAELAPRRLDDPDFRSNFLAVAQREIGRIDKLVNDLMTLSTPADAVVEVVDVNAQCALVARAAAGLAEAHDLQMLVRSQELDGVVMGDSTRFYQALLNLVTNAIDAEPAGGSVRLSTEMATGERGGAVVRVVVHNPGSYIPPEQREEIFKPFVSRKLRGKGTGLGLAICKTIIEEHAGRITVRSDPEQGTDFVVELPLSEQTAKMPATVG